MTTVAHATGPWHLVDAETSLRIHFSLPDGRQSGVAVSIGSTALSFRAPRQGNHRGYPGGGGGKRGPGNQPARGCWQGPTSPEVFRGLALAGTGRSR